MQAPLVRIVDTMGVSKKLDGSLFKFLQLGLCFLRISLGGASFQEAPT